MLLFQRGYLVTSQEEAERGYKLYLDSKPEWAARFQLLEASSMLFRGMDDDALRVLAGNDVSRNRREFIQQLAIESIVFSHRRQYSDADQRLTQAEQLCANAAFGTCGDVLRARGIVATRQGQLGVARHFFYQTLLFAQVHHDQWLEASASLNLGFAAMQIGHFDEAVDWTASAYRNALSLGAEDMAQDASGNLGWAYFQLGDGERALDLFLQAEQSAARLGNVGARLKWISTAGYVYRDTGDLTRAAQSYREALDLAKQIDSKENIVNALEDLAQVSVLSGKLEDASGYIDQLTPMELAGGGRLSQNVVLAQGMLAAARQQDKQAETLFRAIQNDASSPTTTQLSAGYELARLFDGQGNSQAAEREYKATLNTFNSARAQLKSEESQLPFGANAARIYDDYIHLLAQQGRSEEALAAADESRARTLAEGLALTASKNSARSVTPDPRRVAQKVGATLLFYWLGEEHSYLWAITPAKVTLFPLPPQAEIVARVERYRRAMLDLRNPLESANRDGVALYQLLVAPAASLILPNAPVMILADGALSELNFETLLVPGPGPNPDRNPDQISDPSAEVHYLIDDRTLLSAPSLAMLAAAKPVRDGSRNLLLLGNPISPSPDYPSLPHFGIEMTQIEKHFAPREVAVFAGQQASPAAYLSSNPGQYSFIHFVSHAVASRTDPLDSAIILSGAGSGSGASENSFKLYARDIMQHPIDAQLVTISACNGSGTRSYAGEGLVGLSWAFLRAGAHSVIGALWEVSDDSTPRLMDKLYEGMEAGQTPAVALRKAKLTLLHSPGRFRIPFFWAPFQIYTIR